jgi:SAM-dependent methyltransferase
MWAALTDPEKAGRRWVSEEFLQHGRDEVDEYFARLDRLGLEVRPSRALDFGCGPGRLTCALLTRFREVDAVDISPAMIARARGLVPADAPVTFHQNETAALDMFPSGHFSFVLSVLVLQHVPPRYSKRYLAEIVRVLEPGGVAVVQVPSHPALSATRLARHDVSPAVRNGLRRLRACGRPVMDAYSVRREDVVAIIEGSGGRVREAVEDHSAGWDWVSYTYVVQKREM